MHRHTLNVIPLLMFYIFLIPTTISHKCESVFLRWHSKRSNRNNNNNKYVISFISILYFISIRFYFVVVFGGLNVCLKLKLCFASQNRWQWHHLVRARHCNCSSIGGEQLKISHFHFAVVHVTQSSGHSYVFLVFLFVVVVVSSCVRVHVSWSLVWQFPMFSIVKNYVIASFRMCVCVFCFFLFVLFSTFFILV